MFFQSQTHLGQNLIQGNAGTGYPLASCRCKFCNAGRARGGTDLTGIVNFEANAPAVDSSKSEGISQLEEVVAAGLGDFHACLEGVTIIRKVLVIKAVQHIFEGKACRKLFVSGSQFEI